MLTLTRTSTRRGALALSASLMAIALTSASSVAAAPPSSGADEVLLAAQCRYADGTKAITYWQERSALIMAEHHLGPAGGVLFKMDGGRDPAQFFAMTVQADGSSKFEEMKDPAEIKAIGRVLLYLAGRSGTPVKQADVVAFSAKQDVPLCPWKTFEVAPGDVNLKDLKQPGN